MIWLDKRIAENELRIIGLEFTIDDYNGNQEIEMFTPSGLLVIPRSSVGNGILFPKVTFHTTIGDYSIGGRNAGGYCPW